MHGYFWRSQAGMFLFIGHDGGRICTRTVQKAAGAAYDHAEENVHQLDQQCVLQTWCRYFPQAPSDVISLKTSLVG